MARPMEEWRSLPGSEGPEGFDAVYVAERPAIVRLAFLLVRDRAVAEELAQEAFLRLFAHFATVENPPGFLRTVVVRLASTWRRRRTMEAQRLTLVATDGHRLPGELDETWEAIGRLRPERAEVLVLRFYEDLDHREIGRILGCSAGTARSRLRRALADLKQELA
ncbi:MAG TPA: sigma-70 family RNA polymerase sigma factor [Iamia sp.]|nr:sigma-70 family RNA polymerase sigma factor [Iamia sp.]